MLCPRRIQAIAWSLCLVFTVQTAALAGATPGELRVMSFNLRVPFRLDLHNYWSHRKELLLGTIQRFGPDLLGTQECIIDQAMYLAEGLPGYGYVGAGRDDGRTDGEMCAIFYRRDRFRRLDHGHFWLSETPERVGSKGWDAGWRRVTTWIKLQSLADGRRFVLFNTHFDAVGDEARYRSALLLRERIDAIAGGLPALVTGDFNTGEDTLPYDTLTDAALVDTYREVHPRRRPDEGTRHGFRGTTAGERIDWILTTAGFDTLDAAIVRDRNGGRYPSDHFPVTAVLRWNEREATARMADAARRGEGQAPAGG